MIAGMSTGRYIMFVGSCFVAMFTGSQVVHRHYQPLSDLDEYVVREEERRRQATSLK